MITQNTLDQFLQKKIIEEEMEEEGEVSEIKDTSEEERGEDSAVDGQ